MSADLGRRLLACPRCTWRQPDGQMRDEAGVMWVPLDLRDWHAGGDGYPVPDLDDPATRGCLLGLVREAWEDPDAFVAPRELGGFRTVYALHVRQPTGRPPIFDDAGLAIGGATEAEALVAALEAAPLPTEEP